MQILIMVCLQTLQLFNRMWNNHLFSPAKTVKASLTTPLKFAFSYLLVLGISLPANASKPVNFQFSDKSSCEKALSTPDNHSLSLDPYNVLARIKVVPQDDYLTYASKQCLDFTDREKRQVDHALVPLMKSFSQFFIPAPENIVLVRTTGAEEFRYPYTRRNMIILADRTMGSASVPGMLRTVLSHEIFHVALRYSSEFRAQMFKVLGYKSEPRKDLVKDEIINPDSSDRSILTVQLLESGLNIDVSPVFLPSLKEALVEWPIVNDAKIIQPEQTNIYQLLGSDTPFINPDEVLAESFALIVQTYGAKSDNLRISNPEKLDLILSALLQKRTTYYNDKEIRWQQQKKIDPMAVLSTIKEIYDPEAKRKLKSPLKFIIDPNEKSQTARAICPTITFGTGFLNNRFMSATSFAMVACHELAHCLSGPPYMSNGAVELQSDYWSTAKCMKRYLKETKVAPEILPSIPEEEVCRRAHNTADDQEICIQIVRASVGLMSLLENQAIVPERLDTPSQKVVQKTERYYTDDQCRLDTLFQGALCSVDPAIESSEKNEFTGYCNRKDGFTIGFRPQCWYRPGGPIHDQGNTEYY